LHIILLGFPLEISVKMNGPGNETDQGFSLSAILNPLRKAGGLTPPVFNMT
jgi:hypothetical protein